MSISHIRLSDWQAISINGQDRTTYLNSQVTCDVSKLGEQEATFGCHCDAKGKTWSLFYLMPIEQDFLLFQKTSSIAESAQALQKFGVFSKVEIQAPSNNWKISALQGENLTQWLSEQGIDNIELNQVKPLLNGYLCLMNQNLALFVRASDTELPAELAQLQQQDSAYFGAQISQQVWPFIEAEHQSEYIPQMLNAHAIGAISFKKGCYMGQETVARMRYLGKNKKASFGFSSKDPIELGSTLEIQVGSGWRRAGEVIHSCQSEQQTFGIAVLAADTDITTSIRVKDDSSKTVQLSALPYSLEYEESK